MRMNKTNLNKKIIVEEIKPENGIKLTFIDEFLINIFALLWNLNGSFQVSVNSCQNIIFKNKNGIME